MALNPPMTNIGEPCRVEGEFFIMKREGIEFEMKVTGGNKYTAKGYVIRFKIIQVVLTTSRIVCINKETNALFKCFDLPIALIYKENFEQPIFGSNYIGGECKPLLNLLPGNIKFKIWFTQGGCGTFVPAFYNVVTSVRKNGNKGPDNKLISMVSTGVFAKNAYLDPNDPSVIYYEQPEVN